MPKINDLRSAIEHLKAIPGEFIETDVAIDPDAEITGVYRHVGAAGVCQRPTRLGPAMMFTNVNGFEDSRVVIGMVGTRERVGHLLNCPPAELGQLLNKSVHNRIAPQLVEPGEDIPCQEVVYKATDPDFDIRKIIPAPRNTPEDAGPYITMGHCYSHDPVTGEHDITIHRLCLQDKDTMTFNSAPGRHLEIFRRKWHAQGKNMPLTVNIGLDPAIPIACCFEPPTTPLGLNELSIAGALRNEPVKMANCLTVDEQCIANAEYVLECEILFGETMPESANPENIWAMPEFPGYEGIAHKESAVVKVRAITTRKHPIMQTCIGCSEEHVNMAGIPTEASILDACQKAFPGLVTNVYAARSGGGKSIAIISVNKKTPVDQGRERQVGLVALATYTELKHVIVVDDDIDIFDADDVMWAMNYRFNAEQDLITIPNVICHPLDPSEKKDVTGYWRDGLGCKAIFDCTMPFGLRDKYFHRAKFLEVDPLPYVPESIRSQIL